MNVPKTQQNTKLGTLSLLAMPLAYQVFICYNRVCSTVLQFLNPFEQAMNTKYKSLINVLLYINPTIEVNIFFKEIIIVVNSTSAQSQTSTTAQGRQMILSSF